MDDFDIMLMFIPILRWCGKHEIRYIDYEPSFLPQCPKCQEEFIKNFLNPKEQPQNDP